MGCTLRGVEEAVVGGGSIYVGMRGSGVDEQRGRVEIEIREGIRDKEND